MFVADPDNRPLRRPGAYLIRNTVNGKCYVGISQNVAVRLREHARDRSPSVLRAAIKKYGIASFESVVLFYQLDGTDYLPTVEAALIAQYNAVTPSGYNVAAAFHGVGPYGAAHSAAIRKAKNGPEVKANDIAAASRRWVDYHEQFSASLTHGRTDTSVIAKRNVSITAAWLDPQRRAAMGVMKSGEIRITDGVSERRIKKDAQIPDGWWRGTSPRLPRFWINDGVSERRIASEVLVPKGWRRGRLVPIC